METDTTNPNRGMVRGLVRRILLASAVIAGTSSCTGHERAEASPPAPAEDPKGDPSDPLGPSGPTPPESPGDEAIPMQGSGAPIGSAGDEGSNKGGAGSAPRDAGASTSADGGAPRGNPRDGGVRSY